MGKGHSEAVTIKATWIACLVEQLVGGCRIVWVGSDIRRVGPGHLPTDWSGGDESLVEIHVIEEKLSIQRLVKRAAHIQLVEWRSGQVRNQGVLAQRSARATKALRERQLSVVSQARDI